MLWLILFLILMLWIVRFGFAVGGILLSALLTLLWVSSILALFLGRNRTT
jgi:hypothetical protein